MKTTSSYQNRDTDNYLKKVTGCNFSILKEKHPELFSQFEYNPIYSNSRQGQNEYISGYGIVKNALDYLNKKFTGKKLNLYVNGCDKIKCSLSMFKSLYNTQQINENNVVAFFDNTLWGGGKDGFVLTNNCLYIHNLWSKSCTVNLTGIQKIYEKNGMVYISYSAGYPSEIEIQVTFFEPGATQMVCFLNYCISMILAKKYWELYGEEVDRQNLHTFEKKDYGNYRISNDKKEYVFFECLYCGHKYRAKKGKGMLEITCVKCGNKLRKKV